MFKTTVTHMSDLDLLRLLVPRGARQLLANHTMADLFLSPEPSQSASHVAEAPRQSPRLEAARELMSRVIIPFCKGRRSRNVMQRWQQWLFCIN